MALETTGVSRVAPPGLGATTMAEAFQLTAADRAGSTALRTKDDLVSVTWGEYAHRVRRIAAGLAALGAGHGGTVGIMLTNRPEFHLVDTAAMHLGAVPFSIYNTSTAEQISYLIGDAGNRVLITEQAFLDRVLEAGKGSEALEHVVVVDGEPPSGAISLAELEARGEGGFDFEAAWRAVQPEDLLTLIYTSGTTGPPKGVQLTHASPLAALRGFTEILDFPTEGRLISWLPMAHIAERNVGHYLPMAFGFTITCCPDPRRVVEFLTEVHPTGFFAVPRIWEKMKTAMEMGFEAEQDENRRQAIEWAIGVGRRRVALEQNGDEIPADLASEHAKAEELVLSKLRERIGLDEVLAVNVGAAPSQPEVLEFFHALGLPIGELWGLSETCGVGTCNPSGRAKIGTVGPPVPGTEVKLSDDGEVLVRGPVLMAGYRNDPGRTAEAIDVEGWLHTGDVGALDEDGYLRIVDRKKELIINAAGKNMSPSNIEAKVKAASPLIGHVCAIGDDRPYNVALIVLDADAAPAFAAQHGIDGSSLESLAGEPAILAEVTAGVERGNAGLSRVEQIKKFKLLGADWQPGGDELTPTMKLKRRPIERKYAEEVEQLYTG